MTYKRFYKLFNRLPLHDDEMKELLVQQYTDGRTSSLRAMTAADLFREIFLHLGNNIVRNIQPAVKHSEKNSFDFKGRIIIIFYDFDRIDQLRQPF